MAAPCSSQSSSSGATGLRDNVIIANATNLRPLFETAKVVKVGEYSTTIRIINIYK